MKSGRAFTAGRRTLARALVLGGLVWGGAGVALPAARAATPPSADLATAFHYGAAPPVDELGFFARVVLDAERAPAATVRELADKGTVVLARLRCPNALPAAVRAAILERAAVAVAQGFAGFVVEPGNGISAADLASLVHAIHGRWAAAPLWIEASTDLLSRVMPAGALPSGAGSSTGIAGDLSGLVSGPLFSAWDAARGQYVAVAADVRRRRAEALSAFAAATGLPVIDVEAFPARPLAGARSLAADVAALGFVPWVAPGARDRIGVGLVEPVSRRVLVLLDGAEEPYLPYAVAHRMLAVPLEYLGFAVDYADVRAGLPDQPLSDRYAGIVTWFTDDEMPASDRYERWLTQQMDGGLRVAMLGHMGFTPSPEMRRRLGLEAVPAPNGVAGPLRVASADAVCGFEAPVVARGRDLPPYAAPTLVRHLEISDGDGHTLAPIAEGAWGGIALDPYLTANGFEGRQRWILDPFRFLASALALPEIPIPDATTENGRRLMEIHIDGDGFVSTAELPHRPLAGEVIRRDFLARYQLPTTVSIIEGEIGAKGLYPDRAAELEPVARAIFALPEVEVASHTFSHPFDWLRAQGQVTPRPDDGEEPEAVEGDRLDIPGYTYSLEREIDGSVRYIDGRLTPIGKPTRVMLWSGNALPPEEAIARADALGLANLNGDNAEEPGPTLTLAGVPSFVRPVGQRLQFYAPAQNENVYTNLWHGPFYGFRRVIDYFRFTDVPRRLKPIGIYYHFYSGTKAASVNALHEVYAWALAQETVPVWVSEYVDRVKGFAHAALARRLDGTWVLRDFGALRTLRLPPGLGWPDLERSPDVVGVRDLPQGRYVALAPVARRASAGGSAPAGLLATATRTLAVSDAPPTGPYLESANASVVSARHEGAELWFALRGHVPVELTVGGCAGDRSLIIERPLSKATSAASSVLSSEKNSEKTSEQTSDSVSPDIVVGPLPPQGGRPLRFEGAETGEVHVVCR